MLQVMTKAMWVLGGASFVVLVLAVLLTARSDYAIGNFSLVLASPFFLGVWYLGLWLAVDGTRSLGARRWLVASTLQIVGGVGLLVLVIWVVSKWR